MRMIVLSILDSAAQAYGRPHFVVSRGAAVRSFSDEVNRDAGDNVMSQHPGDFSLYELGEFDDETSKFHLLEAPKVLARGADVRLLQSQDC